MSLMHEALVYLLAAVISVPLCRRLGFGAVLGYLAAGIVIGPFGIGLIHDADHILHFGELGVVFLLFIVGLELQPSRLWVMRKMVFGLGPAQVILTSIAIAFVALSFGMQALPAIVLSAILALSSTAFVLQLLAERNQLATAHGRAAFSILLFQDLAAIPLIALLPILGDSGVSIGATDVTRIAVAAGTLGGLFFIGRFVLRPVLRFAAAAKTPEIFTATALLVVIGSAALMEFAGISMVLGAFIAGLLLADSEYRHQLEADIAPFKGLLLGLFFIGVGMSVNLDLLQSAPGRILSMVVGLMVLKALVLLPLARVFGFCNWWSALSLAALLAQGGEFAFILFAIAGRENLLAGDLTNELILAVALSMLITPFLYRASEALRLKIAAATVPEFDTMVKHDHEVIIAGYGRVGQIVGRLLGVVGKPFTALEIDSSQVDVVRRYGNIVHYGDASRVDLLRAAGAERAKLFVLAIDDVVASVRTAETVMRHFPQLTIVARARNRRHAHILMDLGVEHIIRETLLSSIEIGQRVLMSLGFAEQRVRQIAEAFRDRDAKLLAEQLAMHQSEEKLIQSAKDTAAELAALLRSDTGNLNG